MSDKVAPSQVLLEISRGFSVFTISDKKYFFKHFSIEEMLELEEFEKEQIGIARKSGIKNQTELVKDAMKYGAWTQKEEDQINSLEWTIKSSIKFLEKMNDPIARKSFENQIHEQKAELHQLRSKKDKISAYSAESLAQQKRLSKMMVNSIFYDESFESKINEDDIVLVGPLVFSKLRASFLTYFFEVFMSTTNCLDLFKVKFMDLTIFQKGLISYSRSLMQKMQNTKIPDKIYGDPVKMFNYVEVDTDEENKSEGIEDIKRKMKARGGELKPEDLLS